VWLRLLGLAVLLGMIGCAQATQSVSLTLPPVPAPTLQTARKPLTSLDKLLANLIEQTQLTASYDPAYTALTYPNGDVPLERGVCADVVVRALRAGGLDLQQVVHEDMQRHFAAYPQKWGARKPDPNIDHRRVANLMKWFERAGKAQPLSQKAEAYSAGDIVAWELDNGLLHIGVVSNITVEGTTRLAIVHNINAGAKLADVLFAWKIIGHYRYF
jgi:uncharacterized protein